jgi:hypothetical protein
MPYNLWKYNKIPSMQIARKSVTLDQLHLRGTGSQVLQFNETTGKLSSQDFAIATGGVTATHIATDAVDSAEIKANAVTASEIADDTITKDQIAATTITFAEIANATISGTQLANDSVTTGKINSNVVTSRELATDAVETANILDAQVTEDKIADNAITSAKLGLNIILAEDIAANAVTVAEIQNDAVETAKIKDANVTIGKIYGSSSAAASTFLKFDGTWADPTAGGSTWVEKTGAYTASAGDKLLVDTGTAVTITLPASATLADEIKIIDGTGQAATNTLTVDPNGLKIAGSASALTITDNRAAITLVYYNAAQGWVLAEN